MKDYEVIPLIEKQKSRESHPLAHDRYYEDFTDGPGGWWGWNGNELGFRRLEVSSSAVTSRGPWWVDYNHAPPGAGYLHMVFCINTKGPFGEAHNDAAGPNRFVIEGHSRDFTHATIRVRMRGEIELRGAQLLILVQATNHSLTSGWVFVDQPVCVTPDWSEQSIRLEPDESKWRCLGSRHDRTDFYGRTALQTVLRDVNCNLMLILFPLTVIPMGPIAGDPERLRPGREYPIWTSKLPDGYVMMDWISFDL